MRMRVFCFELPESSRQLQQASAHHLRRESPDKCLLCLSLWFRIYRECLRVLPQDYLEPISNSSFLKLPNRYRLALYLRWIRLLVCRCQTVGSRCTCCNLQSCPHRWLGRKARWCLAWNLGLSRAAPPQWLGWQNVSFRQVCGFSALLCSWGPRS